MCDRAGGALYCGRTPEAMLDEIQALCGYFDNRSQLDGCGYWLGPLLPSPGHYRTL